MMEGQEPLAYTESGRLNDNYIYFLSITYDIIHYLMNIIKYSTYLILPMIQFN